MTQYAVITHGSAWLGKEFGEKLARKYFGDEVIDALPKVTRGKNKGKIKDHHIEWRKVQQGGWVRLEQRVERRVGQIITATLVHRPWGGEGKAIKDWHHGDQTHRTHTGEA